MDGPATGTPEHVDESAESESQQTAHDQSAGPASGLLRLQQLAGNRAVARRVDEPPDETTDDQGGWAGPSGLDAVIAAGARSEFSPAPSKIQRDLPVTATPAGGLVQREYVGPTVTTETGGSTEVESRAEAQARAEDSRGRGPGVAGRAKVAFAQQGDVEIPIEAYSFGGAAPTGKASGLPTGKIDMDSVVLTRQSDDVSPLFVQALATNERFEMVVKLQTDTGEGKATTATYTFGGARLNNLTQSGGGQGGGTEQLSIDFASVNLETPQGEPDEVGPGDARARLAIVGANSGDFTVPVMSWDWSMASPGAGGMATGVTQHAPVSLTLAATPECTLLLNAFSRNENFPTVKLAPNSGPAYELANARVSKFEHAATSGEPTVKIQLTYQTLGQQAGNRETQVDANEPGGGGGGGFGGRDDVGPTVTTETGGSTEVESRAEAQARAEDSRGRGPGVAGRAKVAFAQQGDVEIPIEAYSFGGAAPTGKASGLPTGKIDMDSVVLTRQSDDVSPLFVQALATNERFEMVVKLQTDTGEGKATTATYTFGGARLNNLTQSGGGQGGGTEQLSIDFASVNLETPQGEPDEVGPGDTRARLAIVGANSGDFTVPVMSWDWSMASPGAGGMATGVTQHAPVSLTLAATPECTLLLNAFSRNENFPTVKLAPNSGPAYELANARVSKFEHAATSGEPTVKIQLTYQTLGQQAGNRETQVDANEPGGGGGGGFGGRDDVGPTVTTETGGSTEVESRAEAQARAEDSRGRGPGVAGRAKVAFAQQGDVEIPIEAYSFGGAAPTGKASGLPTGKIDMDSVVLTRQSDDVSPLFVQALATNERFEMVVKLQTDTGEGKATTATYTFGGARLNNLTQSGGGQGGGTEQLSIDFASVNLETPQGEPDEVGPGDTRARLAIVGANSGDFTVPVMSWDWSMASPGAGGMATGVTQHAPVSLTLAATPECTLLLNAFSRNENFPTVKLAPNSGPAYELANARVSKFEHAATSGEPTVKIQLTYQTLGQQAGNRETQVDANEPG